MLPALVLIIAGCSMFRSAPVNTTSTSGEPSTPPVTNTDTAPQAPGAAENVIIHTDSGFVPASFTVTAGTSVTFQNSGSGAMRVASDPHPAHTDYPTTGGCVASTFDSCSNIAPGMSWTFTFDKVGTWGYHNHLNPSEKGTIVVQP